jgi:3-oxoadipate enol-lactonase
MRTIMKTRGTKDTPLTGNASIRWVDVDHARLHVEQAGEGDAITMLHGFLVDSGQWDNEFAALTETHHVLRYDARGFGRSSIEPGAYTHHADLAAVLDACDIQRTALLACSGGAATALDFTLAQPERVSALIFVGAGYWGRFADSTPAARAFLQALNTLDANGVIDSSLRAFTDGTHRTAHDVNPLVRQRTEAMTSALFKREKSYWTRACVDQQVPQVPALQRLGEIDIPTVLMVGSNDQPEVMALSNELAEGIAGARLVVIPDAAHHANMEAPSAVLEQLRDVLTHTAVSH